MCSDRERAEYELKLKEVDQLHNTTIEFSKGCLEIKKMFVTIVAAVGVFLLRDSNSIPYDRIILFLVVVTIIFWLVDAQSYNYQIKIRKKMLIIMNEAKDLKGINRDNRVGLEISDFKTIDMIAKKISSLFTFIFIPICIFWLMIISIVEPIEFSGIQKWFDKNIKSLMSGMFNMSQIIYMLAIVILILSSLLLYKNY